MIHFDPTISAGTIIATMAFLVGAGGVWVRIETLLAKHELRLDNQEHAIGGLMDTLAPELRMRYNVSNRNNPAPVSSDRA